MSWDLGAAWNLELLNPVSSCPCDLGPVTEVNSPQIKWGVSPCKIIN